MINPRRHCDRFRGVVNDRNKQPFCETRGEDHRGSAANMNCLIKAGRNDAERKRVFRESMLQLDSSFSWTSNRALERITDIDEVESLG